ncbi:MAG: 5-formyltetrahydrofolate cyclo-ligase [Lachnotalea sp.]
MMEKPDIRKLVLQKRNELSKEELTCKSQLICNQLIALDEYKYAEVIYIYMDFRNEVMTNIIIENALHVGKKVALPKVDKDDMIFYYIDSYQDLKKGYYGILEPVTTNHAEEASVLIVIPGVAFDESGLRIGYGKGYYDKFLCKHMEYTKIAFGFELQMVEKIPYNEYDIPMDMIITEQRIINVRS